MHWNMTKTFSHSIFFGENSKIINLLETTQVFEKRLTEYTLEIWAVAHSCWLLYMARAHQTWIQMEVFTLKANIDSRSKCSIMLNEEKWRLYPPLANFSCGCCCIYIVVGKIVYLRSKVFFVANKFCGCAVVW